jgi:hypothetical protein
MAAAAGAAGGSVGLKRASSAAAFYGLDDETTNQELAAQYEERKFRLQVTRCFVLNHRTHMH